MESLEHGTIFKFGVDETTRQNLKAVAQWAKVNALLGFISIGVSLLTIIISSIKFLDAYAAGVLIGSLMTRQFIAWILSLVLNIILLKAANNIYSSLLNNDQRVFNIGMNQLARYFKIIGIVFIVAIALVIVVFIFLIVFSGFGG